MCGWKYYTLPQIRVIKIHVPQVKDTCCTQIYLKKKGSKFTKNYAHFSIILEMETKILVSVDYEISIKKLRSKLIGEKTQFSFRWKLFY
jgi:hypothetical protein